MRQIGEFVPEIRHKLRINLNSNQGADTFSKRARQRAPARTYFENEVSGTHT